MTGRGRVPPPGDVSSGRGRGRGRRSDSGHGRGRASDSGGGHGSASDSGIGRGRASDSGAGRGRASGSGAGRGRASDSGAGRGRASDSGAGRGRATDSGAGRGRASDSGIGPERASNSGRGNGRDHAIEEEFQHEGSGGSQHGFNIVRDHAESDDGDYHEEEDANATQLASNAAAAPHGRSQKEVIFRVGMGFGNGKVHRAIRMLFNECFDGAWSTYREMPTEHVDRMFDRFRTRYSWDQANDEFIREGFENVFKRRFPDIMSDRRDESAKKARIAGHTILENEYDFGVMCEYPPRFVHEDIWHELCMRWNTDEWQKKSERGKSNRKKADSDDVISQHTGGSRGYDEHRITLERTLGRPPTFKELFLATHLTKESKKNFWAGMYDESLEVAEFCTARSKKAYTYARYMIEKYGEDVTQHSVGDADLWERAQGGSRFGIRSSDRSFVITGTTSSSSGSASYADYQRSQEEVRNLQSQVERLNKRFEEAQQSHVDMLQNQVEEMQQQMREDMQRQMAEFMKQFGNPGNPPP
ncbi:putative transposase, Ptta/En/Spm, plant [Helianthus annuus]|nr:putative transposase, Ptta/En/Spm, plant [Helianthus annuus]